ncbi:hypothetical protein CP973_37790 [Streptomyces albofaciens JCM 4342]|uniref:hypothetical protein n=1 Tax=Streptomyces albofaciens TaxID=66866 RepID=UPI00123C08CB|nr:hypothetical protein [Streptomyces albofaciens]KAA6214791.1 hypothetical protein CP973_37790 [Streptomyces albofaciens JCM 4342]
MRTSKKLVAVAGLAAGSGLIWAGPATAQTSAPTTTAAAVRALPAGTVLSPAQALAAGCSKGGHGQSVGFANCPASFGKFKVRVWCTWAGSGLSASWRTKYNAASCSTGSVHTESNGIEIIKY